MTDAAGGIRSFVYDALNRVTEVTDGNGNRTLFTYDSAGNVLQTINAAGDTRSYQYNESGKVIKITDFDGSTISREYNVLNKPSKLTDQEGNETLLSYDSMWNLARVTEPNGAKTTYLYNEQNRLGRVRKPNGELVRYAYDAAGNCTKYTDEEGNQTGFSYDALGRLVRVTDPEGNETSYIYDTEGNVTKAVDPLGNETNLTYDPAGHLLKETNALGESRSYTYAALGKIETITDEAGRTTKYIYEPGGRVKEVIYPEGTKESFTYDGNGNVLTHTSVSGFVTSYHYDCLDRVTAITGSNGEKKSYVYDAVGNVTAMTDGAGNTTTYEYTPAGHLKKVTDALGNETAYDYDVCGRLVKIRQYGETTDLADTGINQELAEVQQWNRENRQRICQVTSYERDLSGQVRRITDALGQEEVYTYGKRGELLSKTDKDGYLTSYGYTVSGELNRICYADGREVRLSYNALRQLEEMEDWLGITRITNDPLGRVTKAVYPNGEEVSYTYGKAGERTSLTYPDGKTVNYEYDEFTRLRSLKDSGKEISYAYDPLGRIAKKTFPNGMQTSYRYDEKGQIQKLIHEDREGIVDAYTYRYDLLGNKTGIEKQRRGLETESGSYAYTYDKIGRLASVSKDQELLRSYSYDAFGNRTGLFTIGQETRYHYNALNQLLSKTDVSGQETYTYDQRGNLTEILKNGTVQNQYVYGAINRLEKAFNEKGELAQYEYNGLGYRVGKSIGKATNTKLKAEANVLPDPERQIRYTIDLTRQYHNLLQKEENGQNQTYLWDGNVAGFTEGETAQYYFQDELGSPVRLADADGNLTEAYVYDEFGKDLYGMQGKTQPFGYTGYQYDHVAGTYFAQAREYQPVVGRFIGMDLVTGVQEIPLTQNRYNYCFNAPLMLVDLDGAWPSLGEIKETFKKKIYGTNYVIREEEIGDNVSYQESGHFGGSVITNTYSLDTKGLKSGLGLSTSRKLFNTGFTITAGLSGNSLDVDSWKWKNALKYKEDDSLNRYVEGGFMLDKNGLSFYTKSGGSIDKDSVTIPKAFNLSEEELETLSYSYSYTTTKNFANWTQILEVVSAAGAALALVIVIGNDLVGVTADDAMIPVLTGYIGNGIQQFQQILLQIGQAFSQLQYDIPQLLQNIQQISGSCTG